jgi:NAD(P)-dependent dehydrogenase (short-subunit alcohol dehydrogenase family)
LVSFVTEFRLLYHFIDTTTTTKASACFKVQKYSRFVAVKTGMPLNASVASAKAAVEGLTRSLAAEFAARIRVNAIAPSLTDIPLAQSLLSNEEKRKASSDRHPLKRIGTPEEIARAAAHLLSDDGAWITGQVLPVDGGMSALRTFK